METAQRVILFMDISWYISQKIAWGFHGEKHG